MDLPKRDHSFWEKGYDEMKSNKTAGTILLAAGIVMLVLSLTADWVSLFAAPNVIGYKEIAGEVVGFMIGIAGFILISMRSMPHRK